MRLIDTYEVEKECDYRGEHYSVRDNGSVLRHPKEGKKPRQLDGVWTFGIVNMQKGYTTIGGEAVHRIVATAFLGEPPTEGHIVDHIDTNRQNNRPDNLRWVTKLENIMLNEITRKKLEWICGCPIDEIVSNWSLIQKKDLPPNFAWMKAVSKEEAEKSLANTKKWADSLAERKREDQLSHQSFKYGKGPNGMDYLLEPGNKMLDAYADNLNVGAIFCQKHYRNNHSYFRILEFFYNKETGVLSVATRNNGGVKSLFLTSVTVKDNEFCYETRSFFSDEGLEKYMTIAKGEEWTGGDVIDDYC